MENFILTLTSLVIQSENHRIRLMNDKIFSKRMCKCREKIFNQFTLTMQKLVFKFGARTLKFMEDYNYELSCDVAPLYTWFEADVFESLINDEATSNKMIMTFKMLQERQDKKFFFAIEEKYKKLILALRDKKSENRIEILLKELCDEIQAWYELFIYMMLAVQYNCNSISDQLFLDTKTKQDFPAFEDKTICIHHNDCTKCLAHSQVVEGGESVHIIMTNEFLDDMSWIDTILNFTKTYHKQPNDIEFIFDFRMYDQKYQQHLTEKQIEKMLEVADYFKDKTLIKNHVGVHLNNNKHLMEHLFMK